jgi:hypothetical protein
VRFNRRLLNVYFTVHVSCIWTSMIFWVSNNFHAYYIQERQDPSYAMMAKRANLVLYSCPLFHFTRNECMLIGSCSVAILVQAHAHGICVKAVIVPYRPSGDCAAKTIVYQFRKSFSLFDKLSKDTVSRSSWVLICEPLSYAVSKCILMTFSVATAKSQQRPYIGSNRNRQSKNPTAEGLTG